MFTDLLKRRGFSCSIGPIPDRSLASYNDIEIIVCMIMRLCLLLNPRPAGAPGFPRLLGVCLNTPF